MAKKDNTKAVILTVVVMIILAVGAGQGWFESPHITAIIQNDNDVPEEIITCPPSVSSDFVVKYLNKGKPTNLCVYAEADKGNLSKSEGICRGIGSKNSLVNTPTSFEFPFTHDLPYTKETNLTITYWIDEADKTVCPYTKREYDNSFDLIK